MEKRSRSCYNQSEMESYRQASKKYLVSLMAGLKEVRRKIEKASQQRETWERRIALASERERPELEEGARTRLMETEELLSGLRREEIELLAEIEKLGSEFTGLMPAEASRADVEKELEWLKRELDNEKEDEGDHSGSSGRK